MCACNQALNIIFPRVVIHGRSLMDCGFKVTKVYRHIVIPTSTQGLLSAFGIHLKAGIQHLFLRVLCVLRGEFVISTAA